MTISKEDIRRMLEMESRAGEVEEFKNLQQRPQELSAAQERELIENWMQPEDVLRGGQKLFAQSRLHDADEPGHFLDVGGYEHLNLPTTFERGEDYRWMDAVLLRECERLLGTGKHNPAVDGETCDVEGCQE